MKTVNETSIQTFSGKYFDYNDIKPEMIDIIDIAHALSLNCRYNGHCKIHYSVAQHSVLVVDLMKWQGLFDTELMLHGLFHDAGEAYLSDIVRPLKNHFGNTDFFTQYKGLEKTIVDKVLQKYDIGPMTDEQAEAIHFYDNWALVLEQKYIMEKTDVLWTFKESDFPREPFCVGTFFSREWTWKEAKDEFLFSEQLLSNVLKATKQLELL